MRVWKYRLSDFSDIKSIDDFYKYFPDVYKMLKNKEITYRKIWMNRKSYERLLDYLLNQVPDESVEKMRWDIISQHDWMYSAPNLGNKDVPPDELWVEE